MLTPRQDVITGKEYGMATDTAILADCIAVYDKTSGDA